MNVGIIVASGKSERMGSDVDKVFLTLGTRPVLAYSIEAYEKCPAIDAVVVVVRKERMDAARRMSKVYGFHKVRHVVSGGTSRQASVANGLAALEDEEGVRVISVHDGARPCVSSDLIAETVASAKRHGSGVAAIKVHDTIKEVDRSRRVVKTVDRTKLWAVQTPQSFKVDLLTDAFAAAKKKKLKLTDEASALEAAKSPVRLVPSTWKNIKITEPADLGLAATLLPS